MRYLLFASEQYYPFGGSHDLIEVSDDLEELIALGRRLIAVGRGLIVDESLQSADWWHVYDCFDRRIVAGSRGQGWRPALRALNQRFQTIFDLA